MFNTQNVAPSEESVAGDCGKSRECGGSLGILVDEC